MSGRDDEQDCTAGCLAGTGIRSSVPGFGWGGCPCAGGIAWGVPVASGLWEEGTGSDLPVVLVFAVRAEVFLRGLMLCVIRARSFDRLAV